MKNKITRRQLFKRIGVIGIAAKLGFISKTEASPKIDNEIEAEYPKERPKLQTPVFVNGNTKLRKGYFIVCNGRVILDNGEDMFPPGKIIK